jgi:hypothetical protein
MESFGRRYWFYVRGYGNLQQKGRHRACFSIADNAATFTAMLQQLFCVKTPDFRLYFMLSNNGNVLNDAEVTASIASVTIDNTPPADPDTQLALVTLTSVVQDLTFYASRTASTDAAAPLPAVCVFVDCTAVADGVLHAWGVNALVARLLTVATMRVLLQM